MEAICCECGKRLDFFKSYAFTKPNGETVLGHEHCVKEYAERYNKNKHEQMGYTMKDLDKKVNEDETLLQYIQNSFIEFFDLCLTREEIEAMTDKQLNVTVEELDYLWSK